MTPRTRSAPDPRHGLFRTLLEAYWRDERNELVPDLPWSAGEAGALAAFLRANPRLSADGFRRLLENRLASEDHAPGEPPRMWLGALTRYAGGPLDRFKLPKAQKAHSTTPAAVVGMFQGGREDILQGWREARESDPAYFEEWCPEDIKRDLEP